MWEILLFISLLVGQLGRIQVTSDIALYFHDIVIFCYVLWNMKRIFRSKITRAQLFPVIVGVVSICFISWFANVWRYQPPQLFVGMLYFLRFVFYTMVYFIVREDKKKPEYWLTGLYSLGIGYAFLGFIQLVWYPNLRNLMYVGWDPHYYRLFSTLFDPNFVGLIFVLSFFLGLYLIKTQKKQKWLLMAGQGVLIVALLLTYSRSSFLAALVGGCIYILLQGKWKLFLALAAFGVGIFLLPAFGGISTSVFRMWSVTARLENWQEGSQLFLQSPIIGYGFNMLRAIQRSGDISPYGYIANAAGGIDNSILFILVTTGIVGLIAFTNLGIYLARSGIAIKPKQLQIVYFSILAVLGIHSMFVNSLFYPQILIWFWIFIGITSRS